MPKVGEIDFKSGEEVATETGQSVETSETTETEAEEAEETKSETQETQVEEKEEVEEDVNALPKWAQDKLKKSESDKENYKTAALKYKKLTLNKEEKQEEIQEEIQEEESSEWDENSKKFQEQTLLQAEKRAEAKAQAVVEDVNEKAAIKQFVAKYPKLAEDDVWKEIVSNYIPKNGKGTIDDIVRDLDRALVLAKFENPSLVTLAEEDKTREVANQTTVSRTTSKTVKESNALSQNALRLAEKMRVDPKKLAEEDDSLTAEIKL